MAPSKKLKNTSITTQQLTLFLKEAHENCSFASNAEKKTSQDGKEQIGPFSIPPSPLSYTDSWISKKDGFSGEEEVQCNGKRIWVRTYTGEILDVQHQVGGELHSKLTKVLRAAQKISPDIHKRGPAHIQIEDYDYQSKCIGGIHHFVGVEGVMHNGNLIFSLTYRGGDVKQPA